MIPRYSRPEMTKIWEPENRYRIWFEIEAHATDAMAELGVVPKAAAAKIRKRARWEVARIDEIERETRHDVIAFLTNVAEHVGESARFLHQGMTSSDVLDTCLAVQLSQAADLLLKDLDGLLAALKRRALEHKMTPCIGRSHGIHAEPTTFGLKLAGHYAAFARGRERLSRAREDIATCAISGSVMRHARAGPPITSVSGPASMNSMATHTPSASPSMQRSRCTTLGCCTARAERMIAISRDSSASLFTALNGTILTAYVRRVRGLVEAYRSPDSPSAMWCLSGNMACGSPDSTYGTRPNGSSRACSATGTLAPADRDGRAIARRPDAFDPGARLREAR